MKNKVLEDIKSYAIMKLKDSYGYCGAVEFDDKVWLNSDDKQGHDIKIIIELKNE